MNSPVLSQPAIFALELTPLCNSKCIGRSNIFSEDRSAAPMSGSEWESIIGAIVPEATQIRLTGGEPTFHPDFFQILTAATSYDAWVTVFTNGRWVNPHQLVHQLRDWPNLSGLLISLHGAHAESHEAFTGVRGSFDQASRNIQLATENGISVAVSTIINHYTWNEVEEVVALAQSLGAHHVAFNRYIGPPLPGVEAAPRELATAVASIEKLIQSGAPAKYGICVPQCFTPNSSSGCLAGVAYATVDPWGNLRPCSHSPAIIGSLHTATITDLWHSPRMSAWRDLMPSPCMSCAAYSDCHGGCRAIQELRPDKRDPLRAEPLSAYQPAPKSIVLPAYAQPRFVGRMRLESFGYALLGHGTVIPVHENACALAVACNGSNSFASLANQFGPGALDLLGEMWISGLLYIQ
jgi:AdoMet-dependent heme synthase